MELDLSTSKNKSKRENKKKNIIYNYLNLEKSDDNCLVLKKINNPLVHESFIFYLFLSKLKRLKKEIYFMSLTLQLPKLSKIAKMVKSKMTSL